ncbi:hypothetical protein M501DRAFT_1014552 [Patellaria atrata CBS 101060]|uniref:non-specific serine/threonine protein kinase n=1 Tax=Patellaria atrata CBS 101060 TaxID=1346257 RepID=A0A9P4VT48_9PEZI|nr:hypothetical protein M501DRAFT_1014552 [Patellaria atrata CBS 101060]
MVSHPPKSPAKHLQARHDHGHGKLGKQLAALPSKDGTAQKAAQDVAGLKDYQLGDCLGKGAFGSVYRALNWNTGETVAIKQVKLADLPKSELRVIMLEIDLLKNLNHPNIVKYHGFVKSAESLYIILEYCENGSLHSICKNFGKFPENLVALYMTQVLHGLLYLHDQGVIHRDIKGANILTTKDGLVKLADFGVATKATGLSESSVVGTPYWMAPEVIELSGATTASDIWSLGCTVIELLDGKPPYHKLQPMPALFRIVNDDHPPLPEGASPAVRDFLMQCFQKDPNLRVSAKKLLRHPWIMSAKRADAVIPAKQAVKSVQEWNEALKSPTSMHTLRHVSSQGLPHSIPLKKDMAQQFGASAPTKSSLNIPKSRPNPDMFRSQDGDSDDDNWDADFATAISPSALRLPHLRPHDNFGGQLSSDRLKSFATFESVVEESSLDDAFDGEVTMKSPVQWTQTDPLETVRPLTARKGKQTAVPSPPQSSKASSHRQRTLSQPKAHPVRSGPSTTVPSRPRSSKSSRPTTLFREDSVEDYSDLIYEAADDAAFQKKLEVMKAQNEDSFSPKLFHPSDLKQVPKSTQSTRKATSLRRFPTVPTPVKEHEELLMRRSHSNLEIQKYAEDVEDEDFSDIFGKDGSILSKADSDSGSDRSGNLIMINSKLSGSWLGDEEDEDDPFAQLEEEFDEMDLETNVARDRYARLCTLVEGLIGSLKMAQDEEADLVDISQQLMQVLQESPTIKSVIISSHGMLPILETLEICQSRDVILRLLKIINMIIFENVEIQETLCFVGGIPIISQFAHKKYSSEIRLEAAAFVRQMYQTSTLTLQMFISCGGLNVLVEFLEEDLETERDLVLIGVNGVWSVFELQGPTPKNDFCRIFSRRNVLYPLSQVLSKVLDEKKSGELAQLVEGRIVNIFFFFSQAENFVKDAVADRMILKRVLKDLGRMTPTHQITMLKFIKNLSMLSTTHDSMQNSNAIEVLTDLLSENMKSRHFREISNQVLNIMYNLCRLSKTRQEDAALSGLIPLLQRIVQTEWPLKEFALPILCDMAHSGKVGRKILWQNKGLQFYISLLADKYWQVTALDAIFVWLQEETARVEQHLLEGSFSKAIVGCFTNPEVSADAFENFLEPLQKLIRLSPPVAASLAQPQIFSRAMQRLLTKKAFVRLGLLRIVKTICEGTEEQGALIHQYGMYDQIQHLAENDPAILVREMASDLIRSADSHLRRNIDGPRLRSGMRRSSSSTSMTPPSLIASQSMPPTPQLTRSATASVAYFEGSTSIPTLDSSVRSPRPPSALLTPSFRPASRDGKASVPNGAQSASARSRLPRTSGVKMQGRVSLATAPVQIKSRGEENLTPTHIPPKVTMDRGKGERRRRQTSAGFEGRGFG